VIEVAVHPIGDGAVVEQRGIDLMHAGEQMLFAAHVEKGFLLAGEGGLRQILGSRRGAHGHRELAALPHLAPRRDNFLLESRRERGCEHPAANLLADDGEPFHIVHVEGSQHVANSPIQAVLSEKIAVGVRGGREAARYRHAKAGEPGNHFPDRSVLPTDQLDIFVLQLLKRDDVRLHK
jgi:hypothetical protein